MPMTRDTDYKNAENHTRNPSVGSVPAIAPARAAVNDSTSSASVSTVRRYKDYYTPRTESTYENYDKSIFVLDKIHDTSK
jgi:hypothetical protein